MPCSGTTIAQNILSDIIYERLSGLPLSDDAMEFSCPLVVGTSPLASSVWPVLLDEIYTLSLRIWVEVMEVDKKVYLWIWYRHL
jgi:hypothetical protein